MTTNWGDAKYSHRRISLLPVSIRPVTARALNGSSVGKIVGRKPPLPPLGEWIDRQVEWTLLSE